jgi:hypothetical protein
VGKSGAIRRLDFEAESRFVANTGWNGSGRGTVQVEVATLVFREQGSWIPSGGREVSFKNVFRWTADPEGQFIRLEHLRFGPGNPVYLFDLVPVLAHVLVSAEPHVCREDLYSARMEFDRAGVHLTWTITGPKKDERVTYLYR